MELNASLKKPTPRSKLRGIYGFLPFGTGRRPTRCFLGTLQRAAGNDQVQGPELTVPRRLFDFLIVRAPTLG